ncbi:MAG: GspH/FimT family protein [Nitrospirota bacterium]
MNQRGTSLVELVMTAGIAVLLAGSASVGFVAAASRYQGKAVTTELATELRTARQLALLRRERVRVRFEPELKRVAVERADQPGEILREYDFHDKGVFVDRLSNGPSILFYPSGRAATATTITLRNGQQDRWQLTVSLTGRVAVQ